MFKHISRTNEENWLVTIVYNYTENEWMAFATINPNYSHVLDRLTGFEFGMEAVQAYQEEYGNLKFSQSDAP